ncbi:MAG: Mut7-C RNAse domain-containing protein [Ignavibacteria bacterium]|jgi:uncharacterized protein with PIN domain/molybdopterin converting factor small subunit|nr:Mut7-C ubiquitin/RNAse domain-containing protein [Ignavibacteria bacterium]MDH7527901.1 Mut7-C RNAse domain-containing protein [Ignavibacteria bacterium]
MKLITKNVHIKFYGSLKDFLPQKFKKVINHQFIDVTSVKDLIEGFNVPHTEVDIILVNGKSVNFDYLINDGDEIKVYPPDNKLKSKNLRHLYNRIRGKPKFICDVNLGGLAKNLRKLGLNVFYSNSISDDEIVKISIQSKIIVLTKDIGILKRKDVQYGYYVRNVYPQKQTIEVLKVFSVGKYIEPFSRCLECGTKLKRISREKAKSKLPDHFFEKQMKFYHCPTCDKIYWQGSHFERMSSQINKFLRAIK